MFAVWKRARLESGVTAVTPVTNDSPVTTVTTKPFMHALQRTELPEEEKQAHIKAKGVTPVTAVPPRFPLGIPHTKCKRCLAPIIWGEVTEMLGKCDDPRKWIPFDADGIPHECRTGRA